MVGTCTFYNDLRKNLCQPFNRMKVLWGVKTHLENWIKSTRDC